MIKTFASIALGFLLLTGSATPPNARPRLESHGAVIPSDSGFSATRPAGRGGALLLHVQTAAQDSDTETVLSTFRPRAGKEDELLKTMGENWSTLRKLGLVLQEPHLVLRGKDDGGKTIFVEILTWRDHEAADHVPAEVQAIWNRLQSLVEQRNGHSGIEFPEFEIVTP